jgi:hypothetical protein
VLIELPELDEGRLLAVQLYTDAAGLERLIGFAGDRELALGTIKSILRNVAEHGANVRVRSWVFIRRAIKVDREGIPRRRRGLLIPEPRYEGKAYARERRND